MTNRPLIKNVVWSCLGMGVTMLVGFFMAPFLIHRLGENTYGLWIVIGSLTSYCGLLELGVRSSVGWHIAFYRAKNDQQGLNEALSTGLVLLGAMGLIGFLAVLATVPFFPAFFDVPSDQVASVRVALVLVALNLLLTLIFQTFDAVLWGCQRFDVMNAIGIPMAVLRLVVVFFFIGRGYGLVTLALITLGLTIISGLANGVTLLYLDRTLRFHPSYVKRRVVREIFGYSVWTFIGTVTRMTRTSLSPMLIGKLLGLIMVTPYTVANNLLNYTGMVLLATTEVITPWATALHVRDHEEGQRRLMILGGRFCSAVALYLVLLLIFLGQSLISLWVGPKLGHSAPLLIVLALGELLPNSQFITNRMILAKAKHRALAYLFLVEMGSSILLMFVLVGRFGLMGACVSVALPAALFRGVAQIIHCCRLTKTPVRQYLVQAFVAALASAALPAVLLAALVTWKTPDTWAELILYTLAYTVCFAGTGVFLFGREILKMGGLRLKAFGVKMAQPAIGCLEPTSEPP